LISLFLPTVVKTSTLLQKELRFPTDPNTPPKKSSFLLYKLAIMFSFDGRPNAVT